MLDKPPPPKAQPWLALAPMEGVSSLAMRLWWQLTSAPKVQATPFLRVTSTFPAGPIPKSFCPELDELASYVPYRVVPQLMTATMDDFLRTAQRLLPVAPFIDLNAGCPSPTCVGKGAGSSLLKDPADFHQLVSTICRELGARRLAVKMRTGFHDEGEFPDLLAGLAPLPLARLTVHGRTRPGRYRGVANWQLIDLASRRLQAPVVASGDVLSRASLTARLELAPGVEGVLVGRGALRNPWLFREVREAAAVQLSFRTLCTALVCHALLHELQQEHFPLLVELCKHGLFIESCGSDEQRWSTVAASLSRALYGSQHAGYQHGQSGQWPLTRQTIGRLKMLWSYLRSSLPLPFFQPTLLRSASLEVFLAQLAGVYRTYCGEHGQDQSLPLVHQAQLDWLYSGEKAALVPSGQVPAQTS